MGIFENIYIQKEENSLSFLIQDALKEKAPFAESAQNILQIKPSINTSYGVITTENEITRYSVTLDVSYGLYNKKTKEIFLSNKVSATSDYSAAVTYTGFATEIARRDTFERLANVVAETMITEILTNNSSEISVIYYRQKIDSLSGIFDNYSVVVLYGENYNLLLRDAKKISDEIAGPAADNEMRIKRYFNQEINGKKDEILSDLKTKSFFSGRQIIMLNDLSERDYKIITEIDAEWQNHDALTIVTMKKLSKNSELNRLLTSSARIALVNYTKNEMDREFLKKNLAKEGINLDGEKVLETLIDFANLHPNMSWKMNLKS